MLAGNGFKVLLNILKYYLDFWVAQRNPKIWEVKRRKKGEIIVVENPLSVMDEVWWVLQKEQAGQRSQVGILALPLWSWTPDAAPLAGHVILDKFPKISNIHEPQASSMGSQHACTSFKAGPSLAVAVASAPPRCFQAQHKWQSPEDHFVVHTKWPQARQRSGQPLPTIELLPRGPRTGKHDGQL